MQISLSTLAFRLLLPAMFATTALLMTACLDDEAGNTVTQDYSKADDAIISQYLTDNHITNARKQASGLYYVPVTVDSTGVRATAGKTVSVLYTGMLMNGTVFDASAQHGNVPIDFILGQGQVIAGWDEGIALMRKGEKGQLLIPSALAYGAQGAGSSIPPNTVLRFTVQLTNVR